jgi:glycosyltransferase family protein
LIIEGEKSRLGIGNDLFNNSKSIKRIICPAENAFNVYNKIFAEAKKFDKSFLILLALGPTSTVLVYDLYNLGYQAIDIGHIDIEYEWFLRNATKKIQINNKYVNEVYGNGNKYYIENLFFNT